MCKGGTLRRLTYLLAIVLLIAYGSASAQFLNGFIITDYETLEWLYEAGLIDDDEFDRWNQFFTDSVYVDIDRSEPFQDAIADTSANLYGRTARIDYRVYQKADDRRPYRQIIRARRSRKHGLFYDIKFESLTDQRYFVRDRVIGWSGKRSSISIGGIDPKWCGGLVLGSHPAFLKDKELDKSVLYPVKSRYNGVSASTQVSGLSISGLSSHDCDREFSATVHGCMLGYKHGRQDVQLSIIKGRLRNRVNSGEKDVLVAGTSAMLRHRKATVQLNIASDESGNSAWLMHAYSDKRQHSLFVWNYDSGFVNPFGAGKANSDTRSVELPEIDLAFRSRYAGEFGVNTESRLPVDRRSELALESNWWKTDDISKFRLKATYEQGIRDYDRLRFAVLAGDDNLNDKCHDLYSFNLGYHYHFNREMSILISGWSRSTSTPERKRASYRLESRMISESRGRRAEFLLRWFDPDDQRDRDHYLYCSFKESLHLGSVWYLSALISTRFGPEQVSTESTRIRIETSLRL